MSDQYRIAIQMEVTETREIDIEGEEERGRGGRRDGGEGREGGEVDREGEGETWRVRGRWERRRKTEKCDIQL